MHLKLGNCMLGKVAAASLEISLVTGRPLTVNSSAQPNALDRARSRRRRLAWSGGWLTAVAPA
eukprot:561360-Prymnesium_polylepis.1